MAASSPRILHFDHIGVTCTDLDRSLAFYRDVLGMPEVERAERPGGTTLVFLRMGGAGLVELIYRPGRDGARHAPSAPSIGHACLHVDDLDAWIARLAEHGIALTSGPNSMELPSGQVRLAFFNDPDGVPVELYEREHEV